MLNAGVSEFGLLSDSTDDEYERVMQTNLKGVYNCVKAAAPIMTCAGRGSIVAVSSVWGETGASCEAIYSASKAGVIGMVKALAKEYALAGVRVNCVSPGYVSTDMNQRLTEQEKQDFLEQIPMFRAGSPVEIARAIAFWSETIRLISQVKFCPSTADFLFEKKQNKTRSLYMKVSQMPYTRPDKDKIVAQIDDFIRRFNNAGSVEEQFAIDREISETVSEFNTNFSLANIRFTQNTKDEFYAKEYDYLNEVSPEINNAMNNLTKCYLNSRFKSQLKERIPQIVFTNYLIASKSIDEKSLPTW